MLELTGIELHRLFMEGKASAEEIVKAHLAQIEAYDSKVKAFLTVFPEKALEKARQLDAKKKNGEPLGKLAGIPIAIKDNIHIEGETTTCASKFLENYKAPFSATAVRRLEDEGAIFIGKTNLDEFAMGSSNENSAFHPTANPWNLKYSPGGSSGGSAACVAASMAPIALGSETGGSVRQPASFCGITGFKPTYGRVSRFGLVAFGSSLDQISTFAKSAEDVALVMEVLGCHCENDATSYPKGAEDFLSDLSPSLEGMTFGIPTSFLSGLEGDAKENFYSSVERLKKLGAKTCEIDLDILKYSIPVYYILATAEASTNLARFDGIRYGVRSEEAKNLNEVYDFSREDGFGPEVKRRILLGTFVLSSGYQDAFYKKAQKVRTLMIEKYATAFKACDLVLMPVSPSGAFEIGAIKDPVSMYLEDLYTISANLAGLPAISSPSGLTSDGRPLGLQMIGPQLGDAAVCKAAYAFEQEMKFARLKPDGIK